MKAWLCEYPNGIRLVLADGPIAAERLAMERWGTPPTSITLETPPTEE